MAAALFVGDLTLLVGVIFLPTRLSPFPKKSCIVPRGILIGAEEVVIVQIGLPAKREVGIGTFA